MKKKVLIIIVLVVLVIIGFTIYSKINNSRSELESEVIDNAYIIFGRADAVTPDGLNYNTGHKYYYIDERGYVVRDIIWSGENTKAKTVLIKQLNESEIQEIENYILDNANSSYDNFTFESSYIWTVRIKDQIVSYDEELVSELIDMVD